MNLWIDDRRPIPNGYDYWAKNAYEAIGVIATEHITHVAFDHDLGEHGQWRFKTGYDVACYVERLAKDNLIQKFTWSIHSDNPVGAKRIRQAMESADRFWNEPIP